MKTAFARGAALALSLTVVVACAPAPETVTQPTSTDTGSATATGTKAATESDATSRMAKGSGFKDPRANYTPKGFTFKRQREPAEEPASNEKDGASAESTETAGP